MRVEDEGRSEVVDWLAEMVLRWMKVVVGCVPMAGQVFDEVSRGWLGEEVESLRREAELSILDSLTGLLNRRGFENRLPEFARRLARELYGEGEVEGGSERGVVVAMFDANGFKEVNDRYGHEVGDKVLEEIAEVLRRLFRPSDLIVRWGGDEFLVLMAAEVERDSVNEWFWGEDGGGESGRLREINEVLAERRVVVVNDGENCEVLLGKLGVSLAGGVGVVDKEVVEGLIKGGEGNWDGAFDSFREAVEAVIKVADQSMYDCKERMKRGKR